ncbi:MAG: diacylglycerol kinase family protein [Bacteroidia bacterium]
MSQFSFKKRIQSFRFAFKGLAYAFTQEHNLWIHLFAGVVVVLAGFYYHLNSTEWILISIAIGMVIAAELFNTTVEKLVDLVSPEQNKNAGLIKDVAAGVVLICAITSVVIGLIIFIPKIV